MKNISLTLLKCTSMTFSELIHPTFVLLLSVFLFVSSFEIRVYLAVQPGLEFVGFLASAS